MGNETIIREKLELIKKQMYDELDRLKTEIKRENNRKLQMAVDNDKKEWRTGGSLHLKRYRPTKHQRAYKRARFSTYRRFA